MVPPASTVPDDLSSEFPYREVHFTRLLAHTNLYGMTRIDDRRPDGAIATHFLISTQATDNVKMLCLTVQDCHWSSTEIPFHYIPVDAEIVSLDSFRRASTNGAIVGITLVKLLENATDQYCLNIYGALQPSGAPFDIGSLALDCQAIQTPFTPFQLTHASLDDRSTAFLLCGSDGRVHVYVEDAASREYVEAPLHAHFPEIERIFAGPASSAPPSSTSSGPNLSNPSSASSSSSSSAASTVASSTTMTSSLVAGLPGASRPIIVYLAVSELQAGRRCVAAGCQDGTVGLAVVDTSAPEKGHVILQTCVVQLDSAVPFVSFFTDAAPVCSSNALRNALSTGGAAAATSTAAERPVNLFVGSALDGAFVYSNVCSNGLAQATRLPHSEQFDCVVCGHVFDFDGDGQSELVVGTFGQQLLVYKRVASSSKEPQYVLSARRAFAAPLCQLQSADVTRDGLDELIVLSQAGVHFLQLDLAKAREKCLKVLELLRGITAMRRALLDVNG